MTHTLKKYPVEQLHNSKHWYRKQINMFADLPEEE
jgi:hypothetical protein